MSDMIDAYRDMKAIRSAERKAFGVPCPTCIERLPRANPKILQPGQTCRAHRPHYHDPRPEPTINQYNERMRASGFNIQRVEPSEASNHG